MPVNLEEKIQKQNLLIDIRVRGRYNRNRFKKGGIRPSFFGIGMNVKEGTGRKVGREKENGYCGRK